MTGGDCALGKGREGWVVAPSAQGLEDCAAEVVGRVGQLSCQCGGLMITRLKNNNRRLTLYQLSVLVFRMRSYFILPGTQ